MRSARSEADGDVLKLMVCCVWVWQVRSGAVWAGPHWCLVNRIPAHYFQFVTSILVRLFAATPRNLIPFLDAQKRWKNNFPISCAYSRHQFHATIWSNIHWCLQSLIHWAKCKCPTICISFANHILFLRIIILAKISIGWPERIWKSFIAPFKGRSIMSVLFILQIAATTERLYWEWAHELGF